MNDATRKKFIIFDSYLSVIGKPTKIAICPDDVLYLKVENTSTADDKNKTIIILKSGKDLYTTDCIEDVVEKLNGYYIGDIEIHINE